MPTFFEEWKSYEHDVVPAEAPPVQREECRRAFMAGAAIGFKLTLEAATTDEDDDVCEANLRKLESEIHAIPKDLRMPDGTR